MTIAVMSPKELGDQAELGEAVASKIIAGAKKMANVGGFVSGVSLFDAVRKSRSWCPVQLLSTNSSEEVLKPRQLSRFSESSVAERRR